VSFMTRAIILFALAGAAFGQVGGPVLGYLPEGSSVRKIHGIAASGIVESAQSVGRDVSLMVFSPNQTLALATAADSGELLILTDSGSSFQTVSVNGAAAGASKIVFSPNGTAAALWYTTSGHIQVVTGLSGAPAVRDINASFLQADPATLAVSDDGSWVLGSWGAQVNAFGPDGSLRVMPVDGVAEALCFFHSTTNAAVLTANQVVTIADVGGAATPNVIWNKPADNGGNAPVQVAVGLAASFDNNYLSVAGNLGGLYTFNMLTGAQLGGDCACNPNGLSALGGSLFRLTGAKDGTLKLFDASTNEILFVPLADAAANGGQK